MKRTAWLLLLLVLSLTVYGQEEALNLNKLIETALERNPKVKALRSLVEAQKYRIAPEKTLPDPVLGFSLKNLGLGSFSVGEEMMSGVGVSFSQMIPFPGKLRLKGEIALKRALQTEESLRAAVLGLKRQLKELYSRFFYYHKAIEILNKKKSYLQKALQYAEMKYSVGRGVQSDVFKAQVEISGIEEMLLTMKQMLETTKININSLLDYPQDSPLGLPQEIYFYELRAELKQMDEEARKRSSILREAELMVEEHTVETEMARKEFYPNFMIQAGKDFKGPLPDMYEIMVGLEIPLYYKKKQSNLLEESLARLRSSKDLYASMTNEVSFMLHENFLMAKTAENLIKLYKERIIPQAALSLESSLANYQVDRVDFLMLLSDINSLYSYEMDYFNNLANLWVATAKLEELTAAEIMKF